jgi:hypothetical protein
MYGLVLTLHSLTRWIAVVLAVMGLVRGATGGSAPWSSADETPRKFFPHAMTLQFVLGLVLWFISPVVAAARANMGAAMKDPSLRFFTVEHATVMFIALTLTHIGAARTRRATDPAAKRRTMLIFFGIATALIMYSIPWGSRPLFRMGAPAETSATPVAAVR